MNKSFYLQKKKKKFATNFPNSKIQKAVSKVKKNQTKKI